MVVAEVSRAAEQVAVDVVLQSQDAFVQVVQCSVRLWSIPGGVATTDDAMVVCLDWFGPEPDPVTAAALRPT